MKLGRRNNETLLLWSWGGATPQAALESRSAGFLTIPRPIDRRRLERAREKLSKGNSPGSAEEPLYVAYRAGFAVQTFSPQSKGGRGLLNDFLVLETASDRQIVSFARHWGPLYLCEHRRPFTHNAPGHPRYDPTKPCLPSGFPQEKWAWERLDDWRRYSREASTILERVQTASRSQKNKPQETRYFIEALNSVNHWLREGGAVLAAHLDLGALDQLRVGVSEGSGVFGLVGLQLMSTLTRSTSPTTCSSCGAGFLPIRQPPTGVRRYCAACRYSGAPARDASRDYWRRKTILCVSRFVFRRKVEDSASLPESSTFPIDD